MQITYKNKRMIVEHPTGVISEYSRDDLERFKADIQKDIAMLNQQTVELNSEQAEIDNSAAVG